MLMKSKFLFLLLLVLSTVWPTSALEASKTSKEEQTRAVQDLIKRLLPRNVIDSFDIKVTDAKIDGTELVRVHTWSSHTLESNLTKTSVRISATSGVAAARGLHHYLKYFCKAHLAWDTRNLNISQPLPHAKFKLRTSHRIRYFGNACTFGYTFTFYDFDDWSKLIDWMALMGINAPLAPIGQETIYRRLYKKLGLNSSQIEDFFTGPSFLPWNRMGNLVNFNGPLSENWHESQVKLQHKILKRMRSLGMTPILPAFAGLVPKALSEVYKETNFFSLNPWNGFESALLLDPRSQLFAFVGENFLRMYGDEFGLGHMYSSDPLNENYGMELDLAALASAIYLSMARVDRMAIWVLQGWMFRDEAYWSKSMVKKFVSAVPKSGLLILDLESTHLEQYSRTDFYFGHDFVFNDLNNFGGATGLFGRLSVINERMFDLIDAAKINNASMVGVGIAPEGLTDAYLPAEFVLELAWRQRRVQNIQRWVDKFVKARYKYWSPSLLMCWRLMAVSVFDAAADIEFFHRRKVITHVPDLELVDDIWYDLSDLHKANALLLRNHRALKHNDAYRYDVVDWTRQFLVDLFPHFYNEAASAFIANNSIALINNGELCMELIGDLDTLLATDKRFMLGPYLAKIPGDSSSQLQWGALNQLTLWGPEGQILDYATKQWSGMMKSYHGARYKLFFDVLKRSLEEKIDHFDGKKFRKMAIAKIGKPFCKRKHFAVLPKGDSLTKAIELFHKWTIKGAHIFIKQNEQKVV